MSLKEMMPKTESTIEAQKIAEGIFKKKPEVQIEMLIEIKKHLVKMNRVNADMLEDL